MTKTSLLDLLSEVCDRQSDQYPVVIARALVAAGSTMPEAWWAAKPLANLLLEREKLTEEGIRAAAAAGVSAKEAKAAERGAARFESSRAYKAPKADKPASKPVQKISAIRAGGKCRAAGCNALAGIGGLCFECRMDE